LLRYPFDTGIVIRSVTTAAAWEEPLVLLFHVVPALLLIGA
jgi:hypothetical protein